MAIIVPFEALRPAAQYARQVASRPYDVLNTREAKQEAQGNPYSFLHITKPEIDLPEGTDPYAEEVYLKARENLQAFVQRNVLFRESKACYYIYQLVMNGRSQTGLVCASSVKDYENDVIKKHEFTRPEKENDRIQHIRISGAQTGNVFLAYRDVAELNELVARWKAEKNPIYDFTADDGVQHTIWIVNDDASIKSITALFKKQVPHTYIADGHHRAASAARVKTTLGKLAPRGAGYFLTTLFPASELQILDYNRLVQDLHGLTPAGLLQKLEEDFTVEEAGEMPVRPEQPHVFGMFLDGRWYRLTAREGHFDAHDPIGVLDVSILSRLVLEKHLGIHDQRTDKRIDFVGGIRGLGELQQRVESGEMAVAFSLYPVSMEQLFAIADSGQVMPPKSTWFEPKLRDGLLTHLIADPS
ncbi:MAG TPA: DUF1015 family protein [Lacibacter sp.]|nr:DUF1015 family protein [Lacibacter sp.]HMO88181.1 DUF1015 family protein [Lacibacter sp.]HMP86216.1 DUF1015 family protein [Lacibacter sp.]